MATTTRPARPKNQPSVWLGCSHCYTQGDLVGDWYTITEALEVTMDDLHDACLTLAGQWCEEMEIFDHDLPVSGEPDPSALPAWIEAYEAVGGSALARLPHVGHHGPLRRKRRRRGRPRRVRGRVLRHLG